MLTVHKALLTEAKAIDDGDVRKIAFTISTGEVDRDGDTIDPQGWQLDHYRKNPVILWHHDSSIPPIAKAESIAVEGSKLRSVAVFPPKGVHPFADTIFELTKGGFLNAASVGFRGIERSPRAEKGFDYKKQELYEWSILPVPSHREALRDAKAAGIDIEPVLKWAHEFLSKNGDDAVRKALADAVPAPPPTPGATTDKGDHAGAGAVSVKGTIKHEGDQWVLYSHDGKVLGKHKTEADAKAQLGAMEAAIHARKPSDWEAIVKGWLSTEPILTAKQIEGVCPTCAVSMREKGIASVQFKPGLSFKDFPGGMSAASLAGLCDKFGEDEGFFTRCADSGLADSMDNVEGFCADLHYYCIGKWPGQRAAFVVDVKQSMPAMAGAPPAPGDAKEDVPKLVNEILSEQDAEQAVQEQRWRLEDALRTSLNSINEYAAEGDRRSMIAQTVQQFVEQYDAAKSADEITALAKELFMTAKAPPPPPAPAAAPAGTPAPGANDAAADAAYGEPGGSGIKVVDDGYDKLWEAVKAALAEADPAAKANGLKAALEAFAQIVMDAKPEAAPAPGAPAKPTPPPPPAAGAPPPAGAPPGKGSLLALVADLETKVGRVLSGKNEQKLREALASLTAILGTLPEEAPPAAVPVHGDATTPKAVTDEDVAAYVAALPKDTPDPVETMLAAELGTTKDGLREIIARAVKEGMNTGRTSHDGRLPD